MNYQVMYRLVWTIGRRTFASLPATRTETLSLFDSYLGRRREAGLATGRMRVLADGEFQRTAAKDGGDS